MAYIGAHTADSHVQCSEPCREQTEEESRCETGVGDCWYPNEKIASYKTKDFSNDPESIQALENEEKDNGSSMAQCPYDALKGEENSSDFLIEDEKKEEKDNADTADFRAQCSEPCSEQTGKESRNETEWICVCSTKNVSKQCTNCGKQKQLPDNVECEDLEGSSMAQCPDDERYDVLKPLLKWICICSTKNVSEQCTRCLRQKQLPDNVECDDLEEWICVCSTKNVSKQCTRCGRQKQLPDNVECEDLEEWICVCSTKNVSKQCTRCGRQKQLAENVECEDLEDDDDEFRMLIAGIRGVGKSSLANSIAGSDVQLAKSDFGTVTRKAAKIKRKIDDKSLIYFDTPGLSHDMEEDTVVKEYHKCLVKAAPGFHAILIVQKATAYTEDNHRFLETFTKRFGENSWKFVVFVFTHIDELDEDLKVQLEKADKRLQNWLKKCDGRYMGINNKIVGHENKAQIQRLISVVESLVRTNNGEIYTNAEFKKIYEAMKNAAQRKNVSLQYIRDNYAENIMSQFGKAILGELFSMNF